MTNMPEADWYCGSQVDGLEALVTRRGEGGVNSRGYPARKEANGAAK